MGEGETETETRNGTLIKLSKPSFDGPISLEKAIKGRRTVRSFSSTKMTEPQFSQLLWAAQGITEDRGNKRSAPSAGALYPMDVYAAVGKDAVNGVEEGVYHYNPTDHVVIRILENDIRKDVARASLEQMWMAHAPVIMVITSEYSRITVKYREKGISYAIMEAGHISQNIFLQGVALGLSAGIVGAFREEKIMKCMGIPRQHIPLIIMPIGYEDLKNMSGKQ